MKSNPQKLLIIVSIFLVGTTLLTSPVFPRQIRKSNFLKQRYEMVREQIFSRDIKDKQVIKAMLEVPRHKFVPDNLVGEAYHDHPLSIGYEQTISQPYVVALMTFQAAISKDDKVLEIGTGSGYQTAILAEIAKEVYTVEDIQPLYASSKKRLEKLGYDNINFKLGDGSKGWPEHAPFDAIIVTCATEEVPTELISQLKVGGRLVIPVGEKAKQYLVRIIKTEKGKTSVKDLGPVRFVPMIKSEKVDKVAKEFVEEFGINNEKAIKYALNLWKASEENEKKFYSFVENIKRLNSSEKLGQVLKLVEELNDLELENRTYEMGSILGDIEKLQKGLSGIKHGFEDLLDMAIKVTNYDKGKKATTSQIFHFLRCFMTDVIQIEWRNFEKVREKFSLSMEKVTYLVIEGKAKSAWEAFDEIRILFDNTESLDEFNQRFEEDYVEN